MTVFSLRRIAADLSLAQPLKAGKGRRFLFVVASATTELGFNRR
jgi:hypothetical protein